MDRAGKKGGLSRNTKILGTVSFLNDASSEMLEPIIPLFLTSVLGAGALVIGLLEGVSEMVVALLRILSGWISDRYRSRRKLVLFGYSLSTVTKAFFPFAATWPQFFAAKTVERVGKGVRTPARDALIGESEPSGGLGKAFGFRKMMDSAGAILGPLLAAFFLVYFSGMGEEWAYRTIFMIAVLPAALGVGMLFFVREKKEELGKIKDKAKIFDGQLRAFILVAALFSIAQMGTAFFILRANELLPLVMVPIAYLAYNIVYTTMSLPIGVLTDRLGAKGMMTVAYGFFAAAALVFGFLGGPLAAFIGFALLGFFIAIAETSPRVYLVKAVPGHRYASAIGAYQGLTGIMFLPANLIAGLLWEVQVMGAHAPFVFSAAVAVVAMVLMQAYVKEAKNKR